MVSKTGIPLLSGLDKCTPAPEFCISVDKKIVMPKDKREKGLHVFTSLPKNSLGPRDAAPTVKA